MCRTRVHVTAALLAVCVLLPAAASAQRDSLAPIIAALRQHEDSRALALCQELTRSQPGNPRLRTLEGVALQGLGRKTESLASFKKALAIDPNYIPALEGAAQLEFQTHRSAAEPYLLKLVRLDPANGTAHAMLGALAFDRKDCGAAVAEFQKGRGAIAGNVAALNEFGACLVRLGNPEDAVPVFGRILELDPGDRRSRYNLGLADYRAREYTAAIHTLLPLTDGVPATAPALSLTGAAYEADGNTPQAVAALRKAIALAPKDADNYLDLATICLDHASFSVGIDIVKAGLSVLPESAPLHIELGVLLVQMGRFDQADAEFRKAAALQPRQNASAVALGISLLEEDKPEAALATVRERLAKSPDDPVLNYLLAETLLRTGVRPGTPPFQEAVSAAERAVRRKPDFATAEDTLAELYLRAGETAQAAEASRRALKADPYDQSALYHLVICARRKGTRKSASELAGRLARVSAEMQRQNAARDRFRLVEQQAAR